jgi:hypothetical protein
MRKLLLFSMIGLMAGFFSAANAQTARLQVIHNSPDPTVDIYANGAILLDSVPFRAATPFLDVAAGVDIQIGVAPYPSTIADTIYNVTVNLNDGESYIAIAQGVVGDPTTPFAIQLVSMARESAVAGGIDFIGVHGSPDAPTVDIAARDVAILLDDVSFGDISGYLNVPAGSYVLDVYPGDDNFNIVESFRADLSGLDGGSAVVFASGFLGGTPGFGLFAALADGTVVEFPVEPKVFTNIQVIHNSPDPVVDVYLNGSLLLDSFAFRTATPFVPVQALVPVSIAVAPWPSTSVADAIYTVDGVFRNPDNDYVAIATGLVGDPTTPFNVIVQGNIRQSNTFGGVGFVASHGAPDAPTVDVVADGALVLFDDLEYNTISRYVGVPAGSYNVDIRLDDGVTSVQDYTVDLTGLGGANAVVFASGLLGGVPAAFGLYAALPDGTVVAFPEAMMRVAQNVDVHQVFPAVARNTVNVRMTNESGQAVDIMITDAQGRVLSTQVADVQGTAVHTIDVSNLAAGPYFVTVSGPEGRATTTIIKQ